MSGRRWTSLSSRALAKRDERHARRLTALSRGVGTSETAQAESAGLFDQPTLPFGEAVPKQRTPALPSLPPKRPRARQAAREFDALEALCRCPLCGVTFADEECLLAHRPKGPCLTPADAKLIRLPRDYECWGQPEEER